MLAGVLVNITFLWFSSSYHLSYIYFSTCRLDDFLVGAPIYSEPTLSELGRVYVYYNNQVCFYMCGICVCIADYELFYF